MVIAYHGTNQTFETFSRDHLGMSTKSVSCVGFFFTSSKDEAAEYARLAARNIIGNADRTEAEIAALYREVENLQAQGDWSAADKLEARAEQLAIGALNAPPSGAAVLTVHLAFENPYVIPETGGISTGAMLEMIERARLHGHDAIIFENISDSPGEYRITDHYLVFSACQIEILSREPISMYPETPEACDSNHVSSPAGP